MTMMEMMMMVERVVMVNQPTQWSQLGSPIIFISSLTPCCFSSTILFRTRGTVKAKENTVQMGVRKSWMTWKMSGSPPPTRGTKVIGRSAIS